MPRQNRKATVESSQSANDIIQSLLDIQKAYVAEADAAIYDKFVADIVEPLAPVGAIEALLCQSIAHSYWRLRRYRAMEDSMFALLAAAPDVETDERLRYLNTLVRCQQRAYRIIKTSTEELGKFRAHRANQQ